MAPSQQTVRALLVGMVACGIALTCLWAGRPAQAQQGPDPGALIGGFMGLMNQAARQAQQQQLLQQQQLNQQQLNQQQLQQQQQQAQQQQLQQQKDDADRKRATTEIQEKSRQRQQADADALARQKQIDAKTAADAKAKADAREKQSREAANKLRADPALATLVGSDGRDITVLVVGQDTPNVIRNLKGDPVFQKGATACLPFGGITSEPNTPESQFLPRVKHQIEQRGGLTDSSLLLTSCDPADMARYDLIIFARAQLTSGTAEILAPLVDLIRKRQTVLFATYTFAEFQSEAAAKLAAARAEEARKSAARQALLASFQTRDPSIISAFHIASPAPVVCILSSPDADGLRYLLKRRASPFAAVITPTSVVRDFPTADAIFIALKRRDCVAAVAPAGTLKEVMAGLVRDGIETEVDDGEIGADLLAGWKNLLAHDLATEQEQQAKDLADQRRKQTEQAEEGEQKRVLEEKRRANDEASRREELDHMRTLVASKATAVVEDFGQRLRRHMESVEAEMKATQQRAKLKQVLSSQQDAALRAKNAVDRMEFQPWAAQFETLIKQGWEFGDVRTSLEDYGRAQWRSRTIEAIAVRVEFPMVNREVGEKRVDCYDFVWINDEEFQFVRQPTVIKCDGYEPGFAEWAQGNGFVSQWKLLQTP